jgi:hypothetical protein
MARPRKSREWHEAYDRAWRDAHRDQINACQRKNYLKNRERRLEKMRVRYAALSEDERSEMQKRKYVAGKENQKRYRKRNLERVTARGRAWYDANLQKTMWASAKRRAVKLGLPFNIDPSDIVIPKVCPVFGVEFTGASGKGPQPTSPTLDRIHPEMGYVRGNIAVISKRANDIKSYGTAAEHRQVAKWLEAFG